MSGTEEARKCSQALKDDSIYYDPYWEDCWRIQLLRGINFENADLTDAKLILADLSEADLKNADLEGANLQRTVLKDASLTNANFEGAVLGNTKFTNTDLTRAKGLWSCRHRGPSPVDAATVTSPPIYRRISYWHVDSAYWISELRRSLRRDSRPSRLRKSLTTYASWSSSPSRAPPALSVSQQKISTLPTSYTTTFTKKEFLVGLHRMIFAVARRSTNRLTPPSVDLIACYWYFPSTS